MAKIAAVDNTALNSLMRDELRRVGAKTAAEDKTLQAFTDHKDLEDVLNSVLQEDKTESFDPNDEILD